LDNNEVQFVGVTFTLSPVIISEATSIPNIGEKWNKEKKKLENIVDAFLAYHSSA